MSESKPHSAISTKGDKKRKRNADDSSAGKTNPDVTPKTTKKNNNNDTEASSKKKRKKNKNKDSHVTQGQAVKEPERKGGVDEAIGKMDGRLLADYLAQKARKLDKELTAVELEDTYVAG